MGSASTHTLDLLFLMPLSIRFPIEKGLER